MTISPAIFVELPMIQLVSNQHVGTGGGGVHGLRGGVLVCAAALNTKLHQAAVQLLDLLNAGVAGVARAPDHMVLAKNKLLWQSPPHCNPAIAQMC